MSTVQVSDDEFESSVLEADGPVLVDFWAEWCGPCKMIGPALEEISDTLSDQLTVAKLNIDDNPATPAKFGVRGIPTLMLFKDGDVAATKVGALPKSQLEDWVKSNISATNYYVCSRWRRDQIIRGAAQYGARL